MDAAAAAGDWRSQLHPEARQRVVNKIMDTLIKQFPVAGPVELEELWKIAVRFEEKTFTLAINQADYLKRISMKMLVMESRTQNAGAPRQITSDPVNQNCPDAGCVQGGMHAASSLVMDAATAAGDWRSQFQPEARQRVVNKI